SGVRGDLAGFARDGCKSSGPLCPNAKRRADASRTIRARRAEQTPCSWDVVGAMARVAALDPHLVVAGVVVGVSAECAPASLVQTPRPSFPNRLGHATGHAAQMHPCGPDTRHFRLPA